MTACRDPVGFGDLEANVDVRMKTMKSNILIGWIIELLDFCLDF